MFDLSKLNKAKNINDFIILKRGYMMNKIKLCNVIIDKLSDKVIGVVTASYNEAKNEIVVCVDTPEFDWIQILTQTMWEFDDPKDFDGSDYHPYTIDELIEDIILKYRIDLNNRYFKIKM